MFDLPKNVLNLDVSVILVDCIPNMVGVPSETLERAVGGDARSRETTTPKL